jgi:predicted house-cleaning noncanonical NTP pyrophosphatase (MazG superfamily)
MARKYDKTEIAEKYINNPSKSLTQIMQDHRPELTYNSARQTASKLYTDIDFQALVEQRKKDLIEKHNPESYFDELSKIAYVNQDVAITNKIMDTKRKAIMDVMTLLHMQPIKKTRHESVKFDIKAHDYGKLDTLVKKYIDSKDKVINTQCVGVESNPTKIETASP